ncbi:MAG: hypothetical protein UR89_C0016G0006 [Candidatus Roizmanbacteria bacterium GW2011_GWA2_35_8]|uniref:Uncharacterized protein n=1 Tax=Candidatus Roizmanbacteria bacterium GW2011_GWA2_35_8 TaxID=1618479 RepID=A0A0G0G4N7_9BACT|nr:MAG: hypothetical protein UR89_C0016G0006 [Candidatus Roizmanbacteria bacterium GW2011_GWA2_35_8]
MKTKYLFPWVVVFFVIIMTIITGYVVNGRKQSAFLTDAKAKIKQQIIPTITPYNLSPTSPNLSLAFWFSVLNRLPDMQKQLKLIEALVPDPLIRSRIAEVLIGNATGWDKLTRWIALKNAGRVIGHTLCGDSRVICDSLFIPISDIASQTAYYGLDGGMPIAVLEQRSLGAAPRVYPMGVNVSIVSVHCNSIIDPGGCGALATLDRILTPEGKKYLLSRGIDETTIAEIEKTIRSSNPIEQGKWAAKVQAKINWFEHGKTPHITVATQIGHTDRTMTLIDAFDDTGRRVEIPQVVKDFIAINNRGVNDAGAIDEILGDLSKGQAPFENVFNATDFNLQDIMDAKASIPGHTFKITTELSPAMSASAKKIPLIARIQDVDRAVAGINYPLAHDWGRLQWVLANTPEEAALIRERMLLSNPAWKFLGRKGVIVEVVVDRTGKMSKNINITRLADIGGDVSAMNTSALRSLGSDTREVILSARTLSTLEKSVQDAKLLSTETKTTKFLRGLKTKGRYVLKVIKFVGSILDGISGYYFYEWAKADTTWNITQSSHAKYRNPAYALKPAPLGTDLYASISKNYAPQPYLVTQTYNTVYTRKELATSFMGLVNYYKSEISGSGLPGSEGTLTNGSNDPNNPFYGIGIGDLYKILIFDYYEIETRSMRKVLNKKSPLIFFPIEVPEWWPKDICANDPQPQNNKNCYPNYYDSKIPDSEIMILNISTGEFITTDTIGEMTVEVIEIPNAYQKTELDKNTTFYLNLSSDGKGNISVLPVAYKKTTTGYLGH